MVSKMQEAYDYVHEQKCSKEDWLKTQIDERFCDPTDTETFYLMGKNLSILKDILNAPIWTFHSRNEAYNYIDNQKQKWKKLQTEKIYKKWDAIRSDNLVKFRQFRAKWLCGVKAWIAARKEQHLWYDDKLIEVAENYEFTRI